MAICLFLSVSDLSSYFAKLFESFFVKVFAVQVEWNWLQTVSLSVD